MENVEKMVFPYDVFRDKIGEDEISALFIEEEIYGVRVRIRCEQVSRLVCWGLL